jgi:hypothetical protein
MANTKEAAPKKDKPEIWSARTIGSGTFIISKPKRNAKKQHAARVRNKRRAR